MVVGRSSVSIACNSFVILIEKGFVGIYDSYTLDHCRMVKYAGDTLSHAKAALTMAIQGKWTEKVHDYPSFLLTST